ncbi:MAG: polysaccharide deacetylase family sporulation protein PdaB [Bacillota bacterium]|nr:polysaccharide deacetylase family sporulation protein PdaB [Bacillota bacterium]
MKILFFSFPPGLRRAAAGILLLAALVAGGGWLWYAHRFAVWRAMAIYSVPTRERVVALTFDLSWGHNTPGPVLEVLKDYGLRVTFFLSGPWVKIHPEIARRIAADGHEIGSHGYRHVNLSRLSPEAIRLEIMKAHRNILEVTGRAPRLLRTPNGDYDQKVVRVAEELGYRVIMWDTDSLDWKNPGVERIVSRVLKKAHPGDIILMHASDTCKQTAQALPLVIEGLQRQGYRIVTVSELLALQEAPRPAPLRRDQEQKGWRERPLPDA